MVGHTGRQWRYDLYVLASPCFLREFQHLPIPTEVQLFPYDNGSCTVAYHLWCGRMVRDFQEDRNTRSHVFFRWFNEFPVLVLVATVLLVVFKPF